MILGNINHLGLVPYLPEKIKQSIEYIKDNVNNNTPVGRYDIDGDNMFFMVSDSASRYIHDADPEYHEKYIDVQIVLVGQEGMAVSTLPPYTKVLDNKLVENDIAFIETPKEETLLILHPNDFIVFLPNEVHKPLCAIDNNIETVRKVVVKIALDYL
ncbi:MAG: YhcH/YjgK/YiaL family protein [Gilliamella sp.]|uniref:YhcH/YjgK/YiaL family protein n=1 Tax=unclassified Gilliamella TaxID=2685620 RepID=UPI00157FFA23|nr:MULTISPECIES: YhcH/YjgK/YiaL family protein [unclassified Gilliamella]MCO6539645.1 YhcH/YjgK/YiaL family protein [Gilliamella sp.]MCO6550338.1 YhcH/YjgK/YiaL family protein [Gilliamella sp.]NUE95454.1 YhcH/YjgK/YiaL family protein [Gilliamella sp. ESL0232]